MKSKSKEEDPRKRIKETAAIIALLYKRGEKAIKAAIDQNLDNPDRLRSLTGRIRSELLVNAASWLGTALPGRMSCRITPGASCQGCSVDGHSGD